MSECDYCARESEIEIAGERLCSSCATPTLIERLRRETL